MLLNHALKNGQYGSFYCVRVCVFFFVIIKKTNKNKNKKNRPTKLKNKKTVAGDTCDSINVS